mmetsp:Transcript_26212/g.70090  ORF Transcript_26212/g.70090 Transcript_26212/m.70090 type:complete len:253 (+) Transcript_26212:2-760(+)
MADRNAPRWGRPLRGPPRGGRAGQLLALPVLVAVAGELLPPAQLFSTTPGTRLWQPCRTSSYMVSGCAERWARLLGARSAVPRNAVDELTSWAETLLKDWDDKDRANRREGNAPFGLLQPDQVPDAEKLRAAVRYLVKNAISVRLGIMAGSGSEAVQAMRSWAAALQLPASGLDVRTVDARGKPTEDSSFASGPCYVKYNYNDRLQAEPDSYMSPHIGPTRGVTVNPELPDGELRIFGDLPLALFEGAPGDG